MRTHPAVFTTTVSVDSVSLAAVSAAWLALAVAGAVAGLAVALALAVVNSSAHSTIPTLGRSLRIREHVLTPSAAVACALLTVSLIGTASELAAMRELRVSAAADDTQEFLAADDPAGTWTCQVIDHAQPGEVTLNCTRSSAPGADTTGP